MSEQEEMYTVEIEGMAGQHLSGMFELSVIWDIVDTLEKTQKIKHLKIEIV